MKKLQSILLLNFIYGTLLAQHAGENSVGITTGLNWRIQHTNDIPTGKFRALTGYQFGLWYAREFTPRWEWLLGIQHSEWRSHFTLDPSVGNPLPSQPTIVLRENAWQFHTGVRLQSLPKIWNWHAEFVSGVLTIDNGPGGNSSLRLMAQLGTGMQWSTGQIGLFATPSLQYVFKEFRNTGPAALDLFVPTLNTGARWRF